MQKIPIGKKYVGVFEKCEDEQHDHHGHQGLNVVVELGAGLDRIHRFVRIRNTSEHGGGNAEV